ncbi:MAG: hypothetical protein U5K71_03175 [Gracilimonas sp.]|nr:hypothetical protein [Gracilimonas sp.]
MKSASIIALLISILALGCSSAPEQNAANSINKDSLLRHIETLASDDFLGRSTGTAGEEMTVDYLVNTFKEMGATPGAEDGSLCTGIPFVGTKNLQC